MEFVKMHGIGNDYVYVDCFKQPPPINPAALAIQMSTPHTGVGADGLILILPSEGADARMRIFNKDGSEGDMCGNGIRCVGKYLFDSGIARKRNISVLTGGGLKQLEIIAHGGAATGARVDMGVPVFDADAIPVNASDNRVQIQFPDQSFERFFCVNIGNPHAVSVGYVPQEDAFERCGAFVEHHPLFPSRVNVSFCQALEADRLIARVWERGSGVTLACGTGACACLVASVCEGESARRATVCLPGGELYVEWSEQDEHVYMTGPAEISFVGDWTRALSASAVH